MATPNFNWTEVSASQNQKEVTINDVFNKIEDAISESFTAAITASNALTLTSAEFRETFFITCTDAGITAAAVVTVPAIAHGAFAVVNNSGQTVTVEISGQAEPSPTVDDGEMKIMTSGGTNVRVPVAGVATFLGLTDSPSSFAGSAGLAAVVNPGETALEFTAVAGGGGGTAVAVNPAFRGALVTKSANQVGVGAGAFPGVALTWNQEEYDTDAIHDNATNNERLTVPAGVTRVRLKANVFWDSVTDSDRDLYLGIRKNGADFVGGGEHFFTNGNSINRPRQIVASAVVTVIAGDWFEAWAWSDNATSDDIVSSEETWFSMEIVETSDVQSLPTAFLAVEPVHQGALLRTTAAQALSAADNVIDWTAEHYDTTFQPDDTGDAQRFWLGVNRTFVDGDVTVGADTVADTGHGFSTGEGPVQLTSSGTLPAGLALATNYWTIAVDADTLAFATSRANALADTRVDITAAAGTGTHTIDTEGVVVVPAGVSKIKIGMQAGIANLAGQVIVKTFKNGALHEDGIFLDYANTTGINYAGGHTATIQVVEGDRFEFIVTPADAADLSTTNTDTWASIEVVQTSKPLSFPSITVERPHIGCFLTKSADETGLAASTSNPLSFNQEEYDTGIRGIEFHSTSVNNSRITIPAGVTKIQLHAGVGVNTSTGNHDLRFHRDGAALTEVDVVTRTDITTNFSLLTSPVIEVTEGEYFEIIEFHATGTGVATAAQTWFSMTVVETEDAANPPLDLSFFVGGVPTAGLLIGKHTASRRFTLADELAGSVAHAGTAGTVGVAAFDVLRNAVSIGTISFAVASNTATFTTAGATTEVFEIGDYLTVTAPNPANAALADIAITLFGFRS